MSAFAWKCPKCGTGAGGTHGKGGAAQCAYGYAGGVCGGFVCECESDGGGEHGRTLKDSCPLANCYHCGWGGTFPTKKDMAKQGLVTCPHCKGTGTVNK